MVHPVGCGHKLITCVCELDTTHTLEAFFSSLGLACCGTGASRFGSGVDTTSTMATDDFVCSDGFSLLKSGLRSGGPSLEASESAYNVCKNVCVCVCVHVCVCVCVCVHF